MWSPDDTNPRPFHLPRLIRLERKALATGSLEDCVAAWSIPFYGQRKYWFKLFIGLNYGIFAALLLHWTLRGLPDPTFGEESVKLFEYLAHSAGIQSMEEAFGQFSIKRASNHLKPKHSLQNFASLRVPNIPSDQGVGRRSHLQSLKSRLSLDSFALGLRRTPRNTDIGNLVAYAVEVEELTEEPRQSKLSQEQLTELQRSTHFDKKELQQWYKGMSCHLIDAASY
jgi:hypothetical protein